MRDQALMRFSDVSVMALGLLVAACTGSYQQQRSVLEQHTHTTCARVIGGVEARDSCRLTRLGALSPARNVAQPTVSVSNSIPIINVEQICRGIADQGVSPLDDNVSAKKDCLQTEEEVRASLVKVWAGFDTADRNHCVNEATMGGESSYTELFTCLEMAAEVRKIHQEADTARHAQSVSQR